MRVCCLEELDIFAVVGSNSKLRWHLLHVQKDNKPVVRLYNFAGNPTKYCRFIHFDDSPYYGEIYGDTFLLAVPGVS